MIPILALSSANGHGLVSLANFSRFYGLELTTEHRPHVVTSTQHGCRLDVGAELRFQNTILKFGMRGTTGSLESFGFIEEIPA